VTAPTVTPVPELRSAPSWKPSPVTVTGCAVPWPRAPGETALMCGVAITSRQIAQIALPPSGFVTDSSTGPEIAFAATVTFAVSFVAEVRVSVLIVMPGPKLTAPPAVVKLAA
jgi:hypothetical protein